MLHAFVDRIPVRIFLPISLLLLALFVPVVLRGQSESNEARRVFAIRPGATIESSPAVGPDGTIYVGVAFDDDTGALVAVRPNGELKWSQFPQGIRRFGHAITAAPVVSRDGATVYVGAHDGVMYALRTSDGGERWRYPTGAFKIIFAGPSLGPNGEIYFGSSNTEFFGVDSTFYAVSAEGQPLWAQSANDYYFAPPSVAEDGSVYYGALDGVVYGIGPSGDLKWRREVNGPVLAAAALGRDADGRLVVYIGCDARGGRPAQFLALNPESGATIWERPLQVAAGASLGADGTIYVGTTDGRMHALDQSGNPRNGWPVTVDGSIESVPAIRSDGSIVFTTVVGTVWVLNPNGSTKWTAKLTDEIWSSPVVVSDDSPERGAIYVADAGANLYSFAGNGSTLSAFSRWPMYNHDPRHSGREEPVVNQGRLLNLSTRGLAGPAHTLIAGVYLRGGGAKEVLVRAVGPGLTKFGLDDALPDPRFEFGLTNQSVSPFQNDNWETEEPRVSQLGAQVGAFPLEPGSRDAALPRTIPANFNHSAVIGSTDGQSGLVLAEIYDGKPSETPPRLVNLSTRGRVTAGADTLIPGFVIGGSGPMRLLLRVAGPGLARFGVENTVPAPRLVLYDSQGRVIATSTRWGAGGTSGDVGGAAAVVGAFGFDVGSADAAMIVTLQPGSYTFIVSDATGAVGEGLAEVYAIPF